MTRNAILAATALVCVGGWLGAPPRAASAGTIYAVDSQARLLTVDPTTAAITVVGALGVSPTCFGGACFAGLDFNTVDGTLYFSVSSTGTEHLYSVDTATGAASFVTDITPVGGPGGAILQNFAFSAAGDVFGSESFHLYEGSVGTGVASFVGTSFSGEDDALAFAADGTLYAVDGLSLFYRIDPGTGAKTAISGTPCWVSLAFAADGNLYCAGQGPNAPLYRIDPVTGAATLIGNTGVDIAGLAATPAPAVPAASTIALVVLGVGFLVLLAHGLPRLPGRPA
jgi:hypothetical protein